MTARITIEITEVQSYFTTGELDDIADLVVEYLKYQGTKFGVVACGQVLPNEVKKDE